MVGPKARPSGRTRMRAPSSGKGKRKKKDWRHSNSNTVAAADCASKRQGNTNNFEQLLEKMCTNHGYPIKHNLKDCELLKRMMGQPRKRKVGTTIRRPQRSGSAAQGWERLPRPSRLPHDLRRS
jgi:hypothetical protein